MSLPETPHDLAAGRPVHQRLEVHNVATDQRCAEEGACARVHLATGRTCTAQQNHAGSCDFVAAEGVEASLARHHAVDGW